jgi:hypothetical protein
MRAPVRRGWEGGVMDDGGSLILRGPAGSSVEFFILDGALNIWSDSKRLIINVCLEDPREDMTRLRDWLTKQIERAA